MRRPPTDDSTRGVVRPGLTGRAASFSGLPVRTDEARRVLLLKFLVDGHGCLGALGCGDDDELRVAIGVARDEQVRHVRAAGTVAPDVSLPRELTSERFGQRRALLLIGAEEEGVAI